MFSPLPWPMLSEDQELYLSSRPGSGVAFDDNTLILLIYAYGMVLISDPIDDLQQSLDDLLSYFN